MSKGVETLIPNEIISNHIYMIRGQKVMLDRDLARLYQVETKVLKQAVKRNIERFKKKLNNHSQNIELVFGYLDELIEKKETKPRKRIGYVQKN